MIEMAVYQIYTSDGLSSASRGRQRASSVGTKNNTNFLTFLDVPIEEISLQQILQLHDNLGIFYSLQSFLDLCPDSLIQLIWKDDLDAADEAGLVDRSPWLLLRRWLAAVDVAGESPKRGENLRVWSRILLTTKVQHFCCAEDVQERKDKQDGCVVVFAWRIGRTLVAFHIFLVTPLDPAAIDMASSFEAGCGWLLVRVRIREERSYSILEHMTQLREAIFTSCPLWAGWQLR